MGASLKANRGEWSELYAFLKIASDRQVSGADENVNKTGLIYPVLSIVSGNGKELRRYELIDADRIEIYDIAGLLLDTIDSSILKSSVSNILGCIKGSSESAFEIQSAGSIMTLLRRQKVQAGALNKSDIILVLHDPVTAMKPEVGFSIKSELGAASTLLNASGATNFVYEIIGTEVDAPAINAIDSRNKIQDRIAAIEKTGARLSFSHCNNATFDGNLRKIDSLLPEIVSIMLLGYYRKIGKTVEEITNNFADHTSIAREIKLLPFVPTNGFYDFKIKQFLMAIALGMMPASIWDGKLETHGGYLIVKQSGEVVCYHLYNIDSFREYLFKNTYFDTASSKKHKFGSIFSADGKNYISLNLQIRFSR